MSCQPWWGLLYQALPRDKSSETEQDKFCPSSLFLRLPVSIAPSSEAEVAFAIVRLESLALEESRYGKLLSWVIRVGTG